MITRPRPSGKITVAVVKGRRLGYIFHAELKGGSRARAASIEISGEVIHPWPVA